MQIYLPIAEIPVDIFLLLAMGGIGGFLAGMFGIGGGFLLTPLLIFIGVPPAVAVASTTNQIMASSVSGFLAHLHRHNVDVKMGLFLLGGGLIGTYLGILIFAALKAVGQIDLAISLSYLIFLGTIGTLMAIESSRTIWRQKRHPELSSASKPSKFTKWLRSNKLPLLVHFPHSDLKVSGLLPILIGAAAGILVSLMGIGGGFIMIPAMIYLLGMPTSVVVGTSLFQILFTTALATLLHAITTQSVDIVLALLLILGGVVGAQLGTTMGLKLPAERLRILLALIVLAVCLKLGVGLFVEPDDLYSVTVLE